MRKIEKIGIPWTEHPEDPDYILDRLIDLADKINECIAFINDINQRLEKARL